MVKKFKPLPLKHVNFQNMHPPSLLKFLATPLCEHDDFFHFALHLNLSGKLDICARAALGFRIFQMRPFELLTQLPTPGL